MYKTWLSYLPFNHHWLSFSCKNFHKTCPADPTVGVQMVWTGQTLVMLPWHQQFLPCISEVCICIHHWFWDCNDIWRNLRSNAVDPVVWFPSYGMGIITLCNKIVINEMDIYFNNCGSLYIKQLINFWCKQDYCIHNIKLFSKALWLVETSEHPPWNHCLHLHHHFLHRSYQCSADTALHLWYQCMLTKWKERY